MEWLISPKFLWIAGAIFNCVWTGLNLRMENRIDRRFDELRQYIENHYVSLSTCQARHEELLRRIDAR